MSEFDPLTTLISRLIAEEVITKMSEFEAIQDKMSDSRRMLPYISKQQVLKELGIVDNTLTAWENNGLQRYKPNYKTSLVYYLIDDLCKFTPCPLSYVIQQSLHIFSRASFNTTKTRLFYYGLVF